MQILRSSFPRLFPGQVLAGQSLWEILCSFPAHDQTVLD